jgi:hypothetical protein
VTDHREENDQTIAVVREIRTMLETIDPVWILETAKGDRIHSEDAHPELVPTVQGWVDKVGLDFVLKCTMLEAPPIDEYIKSLQTEVATIPDDAVAPATIWQSAHENDDDVSPDEFAILPSPAELVAARMSPASLLGIDDEPEVDPWTADRDRHIKAERDKLELGVDRALDGAGLALEAVDELVGDSTYDVEYVETGDGNDMRAHLEAAARELRAARRIAESVNRR